MSAPRMPLQDYIHERSSIATKYRVLSARFGDGYEQVAKDGINDRDDVWTISFNALNEADAKTLFKFLDLVGGHTAFRATPRGEREGLWRLVPDSLRKSHIAVSNITGEVYQTVTFNAKRVYQ